MGVAVGAKGQLNVRNLKHRKWLLKLFADKKLRGKAVYCEMAKYLDCDVLFEYPNKMNAARLVVWYAAMDRVVMQDMHWFIPVVKKYAKIHQWDTYEDNYGDGAPYGRVLTVHKQFANNTVG